MKQMTICDCCKVMAAERLAESRSASRWISVKDHLPDVLTDRVLVCCSDGNIFLCQVTGTLFSGNDGYITHWMPLPDPPEKERTTIDDKCRMDAAERI